LTNDPQTPEYRLKVSGMVEKFVTIEPRMVRFEGKPGQLKKSSVTIIPEKKYPFIIIKSQAQVGEWIEYALEPWEDVEKKGYRVTVINQKETPGTYRDAIILKTDSSIQPEIRINIYARLMVAETSKPATSDKQNFSELIRNLKNEQSNKKSLSGNGDTPPAQNKDLKKLFEKLIKTAQQKKEQKKLSN